MICRSLALLAAMILAPAADAHDLGIARVSLDWHESGVLRFSARLPATMSDTAPIPPDRCIQIDAAVRPGAFDDVRASWTFDCGASPLASDDVLLLTWPLEGVFVVQEGSEAEGLFIDAGAESIVLSIQEVLAAGVNPAVSFAQYLVFGVEHILSGWDHLAFVLVLCLVASGWQLLKLVTAFTVGHSITLALAATGVIAVPAPPLEATIALSIAFLAREAIVRSSISHGYGIVLAFGLLHGIGFAGALAEFGMARDSMLTALLAFNIGVELGQVIFVAIVVTVLLLLHKLVEKEQVRHAMAYGVGILGLFWTFERAANYLV